MYSVIQISSPNTIQVFLRFYFQLWFYFYDEIPKTSEATINLPRVKMILQTYLNSLQRWFWQNGVILKLNIFILSFVTILK